LIEIVSSTFGQAPFAERARKGAHFWFKPLPCNGSARCAFRLPFDTVGHDKYSLYSWYVEGCLGFFLFFFLKLPLASAWFGPVVVCPCGLSFAGGYKNPSQKTKKRDFFGDI
jgi:hypothetical protein